MFHIFSQSPFLFKTSVFSQRAVPMRLGAFHPCPHTTVSWSPMVGSMRQFIIQLHKHVLQDRLNIPYREYDLTIKETFALTHALPFLTRHTLRKKKLLFFP